MIDILINPNLIKTYKLVTFIDFAKEILKPNYTFLIPHVSSVTDTFSKQDKEYLSLEMDGYSILQNDYSIKTYTSLKKYSETGEWEHEKIVLEPKNKDYKSISIDNVDCNEFKVIGEFIGIIKP